MATNYTGSLNEVTDISAFRQDSYIGLRDFNGHLCFRMFPDPGKMMGQAQT